MGLVEVRKEVTVVCSGRAVLVFDHRTSEGRVLDVCEGGGDSGGNQKSNGNSAEGQVESAEGWVVSAEVSPDGRWLVVAGTGKVLEVWCTTGWDRRLTHTLNKKPTALSVSQDSSTLLVADKAGDVYQFPLPGPSTPQEEPPAAPSKPLLGHLSMLLDVVLTEDAHHVITCDRDEKIRVSHFPAAYDIETFCLGHREFVTRVVQLPNRPELLLSCAGDGVLKLWEYAKGVCVGGVDTSPHAAPFLHPSDDGGERGRLSPTTPAVKTVAVTSLSPSTHLVAALLDRVRAVLLYKVEGTALRHLSTVELASEPIAAAWGEGGQQLVVVVRLGMRMGEGEGPVVVLERREDDSLHRLQEQHKLETFAAQHSGLFTGWEGGMDVGLLYKQRYDNVAEYLKKKQERLAAERASAGEGASGPPLKKGRWGK